MITKVHTSKSRSFLADALTLLGLGSLIYTLILFVGEWDSKYNPAVEINLSVEALPLYALFSALRGFAAYIVSLTFTLVIGYWAAKSKKAEAIILPILDVLQSIPVLGFLPGLVLGLVALFPKTNVGLELAALLMIFTGQVWNMTFAYYSSLKSVPGDLQEAASIMGLSNRERLLKLELPFSAVNLVWNSIMSMAGGWFFLTVCEAPTLGGQSYRLPGLGSYMAVASERGDVTAMTLGSIAMALVIIGMDLLLWRPMLSYVHKFRLEAGAYGVIEDRLITFIFQNSKVLRFIRTVTIRRNRQRLWSQRFKIYSLDRLIPKEMPRLNLSVLEKPLAVAALVGIIFGGFRLLQYLTLVSQAEWFEILLGTGTTFLRVVGALVISTAWALPVGIWLSRGSRRLQIAQPIAQLLASFPAPMLYPIVLAATFAIGVPYSISSMLLMLLGVQWYVLFNTLSGGLRISKESEDSLRLMGVSKWTIWRHLYFPSVFPSLVTGWVTAAGGAWNASIVAEYMEYKGTTIESFGLGSLISRSTSSGNFPALAGSLVVMVIVVIALNRFFWDRLYRVAQTRFRLDF